MSLNYLIWAFTQPSHLLALMLLAQIHLVRGGHDRGRHLAGEPTAVADPGAHPIELIGERGILTERGETDAVVHVDEDPGGRKLAFDVVSKLAPAVELEGLLNLSSCPPCSLWSPPAAHATT